jgi:hypothetical protein
LLDSIWVDLHNEYIICYALVQQNCNPNYRKKIDQNLQQKLCTKAYHIICSLCRSTYVESNKIGFFILWFFYDLLWFFKDSAKINKKEKDKTACPVANPWLL